jgi:GNAT superfamily N-acetyltransferase
MRGARSHLFSEVELLRAGHRIEGFNCGSAAQTHWLLRHALQAQQAGTSRVYVVRRQDDDPVIGFYALAAGSVAPSITPSRVLRGTGRYPVPVIILTRLGVDLGAQGHGLGRALVVDALRRVAGAADLIGVRAMLIHCESESARHFYLRLAAFEPSPTDPLHLWLLLKDLRRALDD